MSDNNNSTSSADGTVNASVSTFVTALIFNSAVAVAVFGAFCITRHWSKRIYQPRTYLVNADIRSPEMPSGAFTWITASFSVSDNVLVDRVGLDAYMFLRFLRMSALLFSGFTLLAIPILIPVNVIKGVGVSGLGVMTMGNVAENWRLWFHLILTIIFSGTTVAVLWREMHIYTQRRHAYLMSEKHAKTPQSTTILVTSIPKGLNNRDALFNIFNRFPGGIRSIWLNRNPEKLAKLCKERDAVALKLESAEYSFVVSAYDAKKAKKESKDVTEVEPVRPMGRTSSIPFKGPKVDLISFYTEKLAVLNREIEQAQLEADASPSLNSAFIQFHNQFAAHSAVQTVVHPTPFSMAPMFAEVSPLDVVWDNLNLNTLTKKGRELISFGAATALVLLWSIPVVFVSGIASIDALISLLPFLKVLRDLPSAIIGIIQGILPPLFLAILMALLPIMLTMMSTFEGHVRYSGITRSVMSKYFFFLVVNVLLVSTISGGFIQTFSDVKGQGFSPIEILTIIANKMPGASTFFLTYALLQGTTGPMMELLQIAPLVLNFLFTKLLAKSPRQIWNVQGRLSSVNYGVLFPPQTIMFAIGMLYSTIAPLVLPFVVLYFTMYYFVYRHQFLYVYLQPTESGGLAFPVAVRQAYAGVFIFEVTIFAIFLLNQAKFNVIPHLVLLFILIVATALSYVNLSEAFDPLVTFLPVALFSKELSVDQDGVVTDGKDAQSSSRIQDEEQTAAVSLAGSEKNSSINQIPLLAIPARSLHGDKQEYDEGAEVSSQLPGIPTPNMSDIDSASRYSFQPPQQQAPPRAQPTAAPGSNAAVILTTQDELVDALDETDPELRRLQEQAYNHPALYSRQTPLWLPQDDRGLVAEEMSRLSRQGITMVTTGAGLDAATGKTQVSGIVFAPGEESRYRLERGE
ncbi:calcium permeable stress-gated cation channel [Entomortierella parvispora]|uniref:Calcium permeable stress-gated cation channel n=1 Tax=Entomortierella parvispora TaxID=205924 RepID=A0A9P3H4G7_9FUNG|nr:calcium permeable stress-gated cation channel [Entomortierella parvispora]